MKLAPRTVVSGAAAVVLTASVVAGTPDPPAPAGRRPTGIPGAGLSIDKAHTYTMTGRIRPLLFWISRSNVGGGRIVWRRGEAERAAYELLIGSDPSRTPRSINRWGYIAEESNGLSGALLGLMSASDERSLKDVEASLGRDGGRFKAIQARMEPGSSAATVSTVITSKPFTFRDVDLVIDAAHRELDRATIAPQKVPAGTRTGFLAGMAELIHASVQANLTVGRQRMPADGTTIPYVYGRAFHDLTLKSDALVTNFEAGGRTYARAVRGRFETRSRASGERYRFELVYGMDGPLSEVPIVIVYQPRWWLQVELTLDDAEAARTAER